MFPLTDEDEMPNGEHKGKLMADVPAYYFLWCYDNNRVTNAVKGYIEDNMDLIREQASRHE